MAEEQAPYNTAEPAPEEPAMGILAIPIIRHEPGQTPNRATRNRFFREAAAFKLAGHAAKLRVLMHKTEPQLLFLMPDGVVYEANARMMIEHVVADWQTPTDPDAEETILPDPESQS